MWLTQIPAKKQIYLCQTYLASVFFNLPLHLDDLLARLLNMRVGLIYFLLHGPHCELGLTDLSLAVVNQL